MSIITISRGTFSGGKEFAENLAGKLGYYCLSREELSEEAIKLGVPVGKLQTAMVKPPRIAKRLGLEREMYIACVTYILCDFALKGNLVYHGHTGHLLLPGIPNIFRIRVLSDIEYRIDYVIHRLNLERNKAIEYINNVDRDRDKWVRFLFGVDWHDPSHYDMVINLAKMSVINATTALCDMAEIPDFTMTPSAVKSLKNLRLASKARFLLAQDRKTGFADFKVTANEGAVQVTCMPHQAEVAQYVDEVLKNLEDYSEIHCTIAGSNILWLGESFKPDSELYRNVVKIAKKWDAAVEVLKYLSDKVADAAPQAEKSAGTVFSKVNGGIEEDTEEKEADSSGIPLVLDNLLKEGCSGGSSALYGKKENLIPKIGPKSNYSLIVVGDLFLDKSENVRKRKVSEFRNYLTENTKTPVVSNEELKKELKSSALLYLRMILYLAVAVILFIAVLTNQESVLQFMNGEAYKSYRILSILALVIFIPIFAYSYGSFVGQILKFFKLD